MRQILLVFCLISVLFWTLVDGALFSANAEQNTLAAQVSPLASPLLTSPLTPTLATSTLAASTPTIESLPTATSAPASVNGSPISLVLVAAVFLGVMAVIGLVIWRQR